MGGVEGGCCSGGETGLKFDAKSMAEWRREWFNSRIEAAEGLLGLSIPDLKVKDAGVELASCRWE